MHGKQILNKRRMIWAHQALRLSLLSLLLVPMLSVAFSVYQVSSGSMTVQAQTPPPTPPPQADNQGNCPDGRVTVPFGDCTQALPSKSNNYDCDRGQCILDDYVVPIINAISALVGIGLVISFIVAGIQYETSADDSQKVSAAKQRMFNTVAVLIGYLSFYSLIQWLVPGGIL